MNDNTPRQTLETIREVLNSLASENEVVTCIAGLVEEGMIDRDAALLSEELGLAYPY